MSAPSFITMQGGVWLAPVISLAALAGTVLAAGMVAAAERRLREIDVASRSALEAGGKLIQNAARRLMAAQDEQHQETEHAAEQSGQAGARLIGAAREVEVRLRACLNEVEARLRDACVRADRQGQDAALLAAASETVQGRIANAGAAAVEAMQRQADEVSRTVSAMLESAEREWLITARAALGAGEAAIVKAATALEPLTVQCASVQQAIPWLQAHMATMAGGLAAQGALGGNEALGQATGVAELRRSIAVIEAAILARDDAAAQVLAAAARAENAADRVAVMMTHRGRGDARQIGHSLLAQVDALHAEAKRLAAAVRQDGMPPPLHSQVTALATDVLCAMERLHATSGLLATVTMGGDVRSA